TLGRARVRGGTAPFHGWAGGAVARIHGWVRGGAPLRRARPGSPARLRVDRRERDGGSRDLSPVGWLAPGPRAGRGPDQGPATSRVVRAVGTAAAAAERRQSRPARPAADDARYHRLELRPAGFGGTGTLPTPGGLRRRLHAQDRRGGLRTAGGRR